MDRHRLLLTLTALGCFGISLMHILLSFGGVEIDRFFGAPPSILQLVAEGSLLVPAMTLGIALLFAIFGLYALSGAGRFRRLPFLKSILLGLGVILTYRGTAIIISIQSILKYPNYSTWQFPLMSLASLLLGLVTLWGTLELLKSERRQRSVTMALN
jgi:putative oxidoreductase